MLKTNIDIYSYKEGDDLEDSINMSILTLKEAFEGEMDENNVGKCITNMFNLFILYDFKFFYFSEIGVINEETKQFKILTPAEIKDYLNEVAN